MFFGNIVCARCICVLAQFVNSLDDATYHCLSWCIELIDIKVFFQKPDAVFIWPANAAAVQTKEVSHDGFF